MSSAYKLQKHTTIQCDTVKVVQKKQQLQKKIENHFYYVMYQWSGTPGKTDARYLKMAWLLKNVKFHHSKSIIPCEDIWGEEMRVG
jgi:hypothetical protein